MSGEAASRRSIDLPGRQLELLQAVLATGKPVVLVMVHGRPLNLSWAEKNVPAILEAWFPGSEGGNAIADLLFGDAKPGGKLPITWPRVAGQIPFYYNHNLTQSPEGHRDSRRVYGRTVHAALSVRLRLELLVVRVFASSRAPPRPRSAPIDVSVDVTNTGSRTGDEVVQLYIHQQAGSASRPVRELKGFSRVTLAPGETKTVRFTLGPAELRYWSASVRDWVQEPDFDVWAGAIQPSRSTQRSKWCPKLNRLESGYCPTASKIYNGVRVGRLPDGSEI